jgi:hypothetical protein
VTHNEEGKADTRVAFPDEHDKAQSNDDPVIKWDRVRVKLVSQAKTAWFEGSFRFREAS